MELTEQSFDRRKGLIPLVVAEEVRDRNGREKTCREQVGAYPQQEAKVVRVRDADRQRHEGAETDRAGEDCDSGQRVGQVEVRLRVHMFDAHL